ncbi:unnamed protein product [Symbiodinium natans]|uniref:Uncharacterized protein n=1 Tax=Symbiodinium natans TaxID=878477 RepID=A0A812QWW8_9DINO|nr:unnamed protein product [Symbiodinium natans]
MGASSEDEAQLLIQQAERSGDTTTLTRLHLEGHPGAGRTLLTEGRLQAQEAINSEPPAASASSHMVCVTERGEGAQGMCGICSRDFFLTELLGVRTCPRLLCIDCTLHLPCPECGRKHEIRDPGPHLKDLGKDRLHIIVSRRSPDANASQKLLVLFDLSGVLCWSPRDGKKLEQAASRPVERPKGKNEKTSWLYFRPGLQELLTFLERQFDHALLEFGIYSTRIFANAGVDLRLILSHCLREVDEEELSAQSRKEARDKTPDDSDDVFHKVRYRSRGRERFLWFFTQEDCEADPGNSAIYPNTGDRSYVFSTDVAAKAGRTSDALLYVAGNQRKFTLLKQEQLGPGVGPYFCLLRFGFPYNPLKTKKGPPSDS